MFSDINVSQSSVAKYAKGGGIFSNQFTANLARNLIVRKICQSAKIYGHEFVASLLAYPVRVDTTRNVSRALDT